MHIPDGFLNAESCGATWLISSFGIWFCLHKVAGSVKEKMVPLMGVMAAFVFVAQMLNFPIVPGTSGHLLGAVLTIVLLGPYAGVIILAAVLAAQALIFSDGGLTTLGANILNMTFVGGLGGYGIFRGLKRLTKGRYLSLLSAVAAWFSVVLSSAAVAFELAFSQTAPLGAVLPAMVAVHLLIGIVEALLTFLIITTIWRIRPDLIYGHTSL